MATMKDVARKSGVSLGTVSNVINNLSTVSEENKIKVLTAIEMLRYIPNIAARTLKTRSSKSIGLVIPDITNPFYPEVSRGVEDAAKKLGYSVFLCNNDRSIDKEREYFNVLIEKNVDGIILVKPRMSTAEISHGHDRCELILVDLDGGLEPEYDVLNVDDYEGAIKAMQLLYDYGHKRIAFISGLLDSSSSRKRQEAYKNFLTNKDVKIETSLMKKGTYDWHSGYECTLELLSMPNIPTAIFAANDLMAIGAIKAIKENGLDIPKDISVIGYDDIEMAKLCVPQLTTIRQPKYELGKLSVEILVNKINMTDANKKTKGSITTLETDIVIRESVGFLGNIKA